MIGIYVLIIYVGSYSGTVIQQEFNSKELCEAARTDIIKQAERYSRVWASGCYKK